MKYKLLVIFLMMLSFQSVMAQKKQTAQQLIEQSKKEIENDKDMDPDQKALLLKMINSQTVKAARKKMDDPDSKMEAGFQMEEKMTSLPLPDKKRLAAIPAKTFTKSQLVQYVNEIYSKLRTTVSPEAKIEADKVIAGENGNGRNLNAAALAAWYNGSPEIALLLSAKSVVSTNSTNAINNFSAMLNLTGHEEKAVPLLWYAIQLDSTNASLYNNLGTAWLGLGEKQKAKKMFLSSVHYSPNQPEANNSLGCLYEAEGDTKNATAHFENSLKGAYNQNADEHLSKLNPDYNLPVLMKYHYKAPKYFDQWKIEVPAECTDIVQQDSVAKIHGAFQNGLASLLNQYEVFEQQANDDLADQRKQLQNTLVKVLNTGGNFKLRTAPFEVIAMKMLVKLAVNYANDKQLAIHDYQQNYQYLIADYDQEKKALQDKFDEAKSKLVFEGEGGKNDEAELQRVSKEYCDNQRKLADKTQNEAAELHTDFKNRYRRIVLDYFDNRVYWAGMISTFPATVNVETYNAIIDFIRELNYISSTTPFIDAHLCTLSPRDGQRLPPDEFGIKNKPDCPLSVDIAFLVGKLSLDCTSFSINGGELVKVGYKKDFSNNQSTLSIGAGLTAQIGTGRINAGINADESIFISFNDNGQPCDVGLKAGLSASANGGVISAGADAGYTVSMNSGWSFNHSGLNSSVSL